MVIIKMIYHETWEDWCLFHSFSKSLLSTYSVPGTVLREIAVNEKIVLP